MLAWVNHGLCSLLNSRWLSAVRSRLDSESLLWGRFSSHRAVDSLFSGAVESRWVALELEVVFQLMIFVQRPRGYECPEVASAADYTLVGLILLQETHCYSRKQGDASIVSESSLA